MRVYFRNARVLFPLYISKGPRVENQSKEKTVTHRFEKFWFYNHGVIDRPPVRTYVHPSIYANVTSIMLVYIIHLLYWIKDYIDQLTPIKTRYPLTSIT